MKLLTSSIESEHGESFAGFGGGGDFGGGGAGGIFDYCGCRTPASEREDEPFRSKKVSQRKPGKLGQRKGTDALRRENKIVRDVVKELGLTADQQEQLHRELGKIKKELSYQEVLDEARALFDK